MTKTYRVDYLDDHRLGHDPVVIFDLTRAEAMKKARGLSNKHMIVYVVASEGGEDIGQRVYIRGAFSHQDEAF